jgi:hypothetical protein
MDSQARERGAEHLLIEDKAFILAYKEAGWSTKNTAEGWGMTRPPSIVF